MTGTKEPIEKNLRVPKTRNQNNWKDGESIRVVKTIKRQANNGSFTKRVQRVTLDMLLVTRLEREEKVGERKGS